MDPDGEQGAVVVRMWFGLSTVALAAAAAAVALGGGPVPLALTLAALAAGVAATRAARHRRAHLLGSFVLLRVGLVLAVGALYQRREPTERTAVWVAAVVLILVVTGEGVLRRIVRGRRYYGAHLPGAPALPPAIVATWWVSAGWWSVLVAGPVLAGARAAGWWWVLGAAAEVAVSALVLLGAARQIPPARRARVTLRADLERYAPEFAIYTAYPKDAAYQVRMWLPYLERTGRRFVIIARHEVPARVLAELTDVPVLCCRTSRELERALVPSLTTVFYVNASSGNGEMVRHSHLTHVFLGHGDSDKATSYNPTHAMYDTLFAAGTAAVDRYAAHGVSIPRARFCLVGRPQVEAVQPATRAVGEVERPVVLYAPTWRGQVDETKLYSLPHGERIVRELLARGTTVIFRPHPFSRDEPADRMVIEAIQQMLREDSAAHGRGHLFGPAAETDLTVFDCMNASDAMISDVSSVVSDYLQSKKPLAMYVPAELASDFVTAFPVARAAYLIEADLTNVADALTLLLDTDPLRPVRDRVRIEYLGDFPAQNYAAAFVTEADRVIAGSGGPRGSDEEDLDWLDPALVDSAAEQEDDPALPHAEVETAGIGSSETAAAPVGSAADPAGPTDPADPTDPAEELAPAEESAPAEDSRDESASATDGSSADAATEDDPADGGPPAAGRRRRGLIGLTLDRQLLDAVSVVLAAVAAVAASSPAPPVVAVLLCLAVLGWLGWLRPPWREVSKTRMLGAFAGQRCLLVLAGYGLFLRHGQSRSAAAAALALLIGAVALESWIRAVLDTPRLRLRNLPTLDYTPTAPDLNRRVYPMSASALTIDLVLAGAGGPAGPAVAVSALLVLVLGGLLGADLRLLLASERARHALPAALADYGPRFVVYFASVAGAGYQLGMWLPYFERIGRPFVVIVRYSSSIAPIGELTDAPILLCPTLRSLEEAISPSLTTVFYVNNGLKNTHFIERRELTHIWLNHGDSEKPACFNPVHAIYDRIFAAGQAGVDRYRRHGVDIAPEKFEIVGRPQVETIHRARQPISAIDPPTVLYAPTWVGPFADSNVYSLPVGYDIVEALLERGCTVIFRAHPLNYRYPRARQLIRRICALLAQDRDRTGRAHLWGAAAERELSIQDCFNRSDAMICDVSAVVSDYLYSDKPFAIVAVAGTGDQLVATAPVANGAYILAGDLGNLDRTLDDLLHDDPRRAQRRDTKIYYLGAVDTEDYADGFLQAARRHVDAVRQDAQVIGAR